MGLLLMLIAAALFITAYHTYGRWIARKFKIDYTKKTPAHEHRDGVDFEPAKRYVLLGHHFASIAGVGPIVGPIAGAMFGWLPVFLWIILGNIFMGAVHDFASLVVSVRNGGKSIGGLMEEYLGKAGKRVFLVFTWLALVLIIAVFTIVVANTFTAYPQVATASGAFMLIAVLFGYAVYVKKTPVFISTVIGVVLLLGAIAFGGIFPVKFTYTVWVIILFAYIFIASVTPVWILLQPRDYLNSFLLYMIIIAGFIGVIVYRPEISLPAFTGFNVKNVGYMFPILFVTVACGAISGFHSIVASGTVSKQLDSKKDMQFVGYGGMLLEGMLAVIALITAAMLTQQNYMLSLSVGKPEEIFIKGIAAFTVKMGLPFEAGVSFCALVISAFALTTLDTAARLGRYTFQELFEVKKTNNPVLGNMYVATIITVGVAALFAFNKSGTMAIWPVFGSANQLLACLALLAVTAYFAKRKENNLFVKIPAVFMFLVTISAIAFLMAKNFTAKNYPLAVLSFLLLATAVYVVKLARDKKVI
ncbi:MAG: carbon starvation protein A [Candidatus Goldbacteria bacterium]|nr:carbon starvation protein A [Candidatus Goldiibacteriota bacterium]